MQFTLLASSLMALIAAANANPVARAMLDVWAPKIISPDASTTWTEGQKYNVTWDTSDAPQNISNGASVVLGENGALQTDKVLASGFDLRQGWVEVTCPDDITPGDAYSIILFGDSGDQSEQFSIVASDDSTSDDSTSSLL